MPFERMYLVPDYYRDFVCKGSACRRTCCRDWRVTLSFKEYNRLIGLDCSKNLRKKLDCAFIPANNRDFERYAVINPNYEGYCPMRMPDGWCGLHMEAGEAVLPAICRYYPRAPRNRFQPECSCTNSCERVIEMLMGREEKLTFENLSIAFDFDDGTRSAGVSEIEVYEKISAYSIDILEDITRSLADRLFKLGQFIYEADYLLEGDINEKMEMLIFKSRGEAYPVIGRTEADVIRGFEIQRKISEWFERNSLSLSEYSDTIDKLFSGERGGYNYADAERSFFKRFPHFDKKLEYILVNHLFYVQFPYAEGCRNFKEAYAALIGAYAFLRYMVYGYMAEKTSDDDLIDVIGAVFRIVEHSAFYKKVNIMLRAEGLVTLEEIARCLLPLPIVFLSRSA